MCVKFNKHSIGTSIERARPLNVNLCPSRYPLEAPLSVTWPTSSRQRLFVERVKFFVKPLFNLKFQLHLTWPLLQHRRMGPLSPSRVSIVSKDACWHFPLHGSLIVSTLCEWFLVKWSVDILVSANDHLGASTCTSSMYFYWLTDTKQMSLHCCH